MISSKHVMIIILNPGQTNEFANDGVNLEAAIEMIWVQRLHQSIQWDSWSKIARANNTANTGSITTVASNTRSTGYMGSIHST